MSFRRAIEMNSHWWNRLLARFGLKEVSEAEWKDTIDRVHKAASSRRPGKRICAKCAKGILKRHKWQFNEQGLAQHRFCDKPESRDGTEPAAAPKELNFPVDSTKDKSCAVEVNHLAEIRE
jgi:hypothetical protein